jgi:predicted benzoate:H+ symporter BenE
MPNSIAAFLAHPFNSDQSAVGWFLFVGLIIVLLGMWHLIIRELRSEL